jgi:predicted site-specific integrase-resolvase
MKLSDYAKSKAISYQTAWRMWKRGELKATQLPTGTVIVDDYKIIVVEHKDRLTRIGFNYLKVLLNKQGKDIEVVNQAEEETEDMMQDFISIITRFCTRIYGLRRRKRKTERGL